MYDRLYLVHIVTCVRTLYEFMNFLCLEMVMSAPLVIYPSYVRIHTVVGILYSIKVYMFCMYCTLYRQTVGAFLGAQGGAK